MKAGLSVVAVFVFVLPAWASEPGEPLDCSDFVFFEPAFTCSVFRMDNDAKGSNLVTDNEGNMITLRFTYIEVYQGGDHTLAKIEIVRTGSSSQDVIGVIEDRISGHGRDQTRPMMFYDWIIDRGGGATHNGLVLEPIAFDAVNGRLLIPLLSRCSFCSNPYPDENWTAAIDGFATLFEVLQTYETATSNVGFRVPYMPEGMEAVDWFDTYWGDLSTVGDWSQAQPLECGYPATTTEVGDHLEVADTLPTPGVGHGYYYVTAATYQGETRYGRKATGGSLSGRDPAVLSVCD